MEPFYSAWMFYMDIFIVIGLNAPSFYLSKAHYLSSLLRPANSQYITKNLQLTGALPQMPHLEIRMIKPEQNTNERIPSYRKAEDRKCKFNQRVF